MNEKKRDTILRAVISILTVAIGAVALAVCMKNADRINTALDTFGGAVAADKYRGRGALDSEPSSSANIRLLFQADGQNPNYFSENKLPHISETQTAVCGVFLLRIIALRFRVSFFRDFFTITPYFGQKIKN